MKKPTGDYIYFHVLPLLRMSVFGLNTVELMKKNYYFKYISV